MCLTHCLLPDCLLSRYINTKADMNFLVAKPDRKGWTGLILQKLKEGLAD